MNEKLRAFLLRPPGLALLGALIAAPHLVHVLHGPAVEATEHPDRPLQFEGMVRDVLWEGLDRDVKEEFAAIDPREPHVKWLELRRVGTASDQLRAYGAPRARLFIGVRAASGVQPSTKRSEEPRA